MRGWFLRCKHIHPGSGSGGVVRATIAKYLERQRRGCRRCTGYDISLEQNPGGSVGRALSRLVQAVSRCTSSRPNQHTEPDQPTNQPTNQPTIRPTRLHWLFAGVSHIHPSSLPRCTCSPPLQRASFPPSFPPKKRVYIIYIYYIRNLVGGWRLFDERNDAAVFFSPPPFLPAPVSKVAAGSRLPDNLLNPEPTTIRTSIRRVYGYPYAIFQTNVP